MKLLIIARYKKLSKDYKTLHKIIFDDKPKEKPDLSTPEGRKYENQRIAAVLNLREHCII